MMSTSVIQEENSAEEEELKGTKRKISLSNCGVCGSEEAKYRCPACLAYSCRLLCVKKHKEDTGCSGVRDKTAFVTLSNFDEMTLLSDYRLLEDTGRFADGATRDNLLRAPRSTPKAKRLAACARKMNITVRFLPITFTKSKENSTVFFTNSAVEQTFKNIEKFFLWHLKLIFPQSSTEFSQRRVPDTQTLEQILTSYIHPTESDPVTRQKLKIYVHSPSDHVKVFMKAEGRKANSLRYHELDINRTLRDNLSYKTLVEYPVLHVVLRDHWKEYPLRGTAEPASTCSGFAAKKDGVNRAKGVSQVSPSLQRAGTPGGTNICTPGGTNICTPGGTNICTPGGTNICTPGGTNICTPETSPEADTPRVKRAKRDTRDVDLEEGEITDSSDEEGEEEEQDKGNADENAPCDDDDDNDMEEMKDAAADSVGLGVDGGLSKHSDTVELSVKSGDVRVTQ